MNNQLQTEIIDFDLLAESTPEMLGDFLQKQSTPVKDRKVRVYAKAKAVVSKALSNDPVDTTKLRKLQTPVEALTAHANYILKSSITNTQQFRDILEQIEECKRYIVQFNGYDPNNRLDYYKKKLKELVEQQTQFVKILNSNSFIRNKNSQEKFVNVKSMLSRDTYLIAFKEKESSLHTQLQQSSPYYLVEKMRAFREQINLRNIHGKVVIEDLDDMFNNVETNLDQMLTDQEISEDRVTDVMVKFTYSQEENNKVVQSSDNNLVDGYQEYCSEIANIINTSRLDVADMPLGTIFSRLKKALTEKDEKLIEEYNYVRLMIMNRSSEIYADINNEKFSISDLIYQNYSVLTPDGEKKAREILASSSIKTVKGIAYRICLKYKNLERYDDAISYGLMGLSLAINKYIEMQKSSPNKCINFKTMINSFVVSSIKTGFVEMSSMGTASSSYIQRQNMILNKRMKNFIRYNPEYASVDQEELRKMLAEDDDFMSNVRITSQSQFVNPDTNEESNEIWDTVCKSKESLTAFTDSKSDHKLLMQSIKKMLNLFETKVGSDNSSYSTGKKLFDKYDTRLFEMSFGFDYKRNCGDIMTNGSANYTQLEMAKELEKMYKSEGITKTFSQPAIASRLVKIYEKVRFVVNNNPSLKRAFEYINKVYYENHEYMNYLSNCREEDGMSLMDSSLQTITIPVCDEQLNKMQFKQISLDGCITNSDEIGSEICEMFNEQML